MDDQMNNNGSNGPVQYQPTTPVPEDGEKDGMAVAILVLGILSIVCCAPCGIVALVLRSSNKDQISADKQGMVTAGFITSIIGICLWVIGIIAYIFIGAATFATLV